MLNEESLFPKICSCIYLKFLKQKMTDQLNEITQNRNATNLYRRSVSLHLDKLHQNETNSILTAHQKHELMGKQNKNLVEPKCCIGVRLSV